MKKFLFIVLFLTFGNCYSVSVEVKNTDRLFGNTLEVRNKSNIKVYAAPYYKKSFWSFECKRCGVIKTIFPNRSKNIRRPSSDIEYDRKLLLADSKKELKRTLSKKEYKMCARVAIGGIKGERFYAYLKDNVLSGYNYVQWKVMKPFVDFVENSVDYVVEKAAKLISKDAHVNEIASVRQGTDIPADEKNYIMNRDIVSKKNLEKFLGMRLTKNQVPKISFCFSGGGYRAMLGSFGALSGAKDIGLLDSVSYMSGLSGSTLTLFSWLTSNRSLEEYGKILSKNVRDTIFTLNLNYQKLIQNLTKKFISKQKISLVDIFGFLLSNKLLSEFGKEKYNMGMSQSSKLFKNGKYPLPIGTAVETLENYEWFEFTPFEVGSNYFKSYIPTWAFGRNFVNGKSIGFAPEQSLGFFMGLFCSAFSADVEKVVETIRNFIGEDNNILEFANNVATESDVGDPRFAPTEVNNFTYGMFDSQMQNVEQLELVDAGHDFTLPFPPLLRPERNVDIIFVGDYGFMGTYKTEMQKAEKYAAKRGLKFPKIDYEKLEKNVISVFKDENDPTVPVVIYFPLIKNNKYSRRFDPKTAGYCNTLNFEYSEREFNELSGLTKYAFTSNKEKIKEVIKQVIASRS